MHPFIEASRELGMIGLRGILEFDMDPTAEPDPDNAGGGNEAMVTLPSAEGFFYALCSNLHSPEQNVLITIRPAPLMMF
jgi:hypothetical protein